MHDAGTISRALAARALTLCHELLPAGVRDGAEWRVGSIAGEKGRSLAVHIGNRKAGVWKDFSADIAGDALDLVAAVRFSGDKGEALKWARAWLGMPLSGSSTAPREDAGRPHIAESTERRSLTEDDLRRQRLVRKIFLSAQPRLSGTPVDLYLKGRGIDLAQLGRQPGSLRFHPALHNSESRQPWPALVAAVIDPEGAISAVHRTWLGQDRAGQWRKAPLQAPKASLGRVAGGTIRLWRGASGKALADAPQGDTVVVAEGIETALSIAVSCPELRVLSGVSLGNLGRIELPPAITIIIIAADNDPVGGPAEVALLNAVTRLARPGRTVRIARSPIGSDFNDCLMA